MKVDVGALGGNKAVPLVLGPAVIELVAVVEVREEVVVYLGQRRRQIDKLDATGVEGVVIQMRNALGHNDARDVGKQEGGVLKRNDKEDDGAEVGNDESPGNGECDYADDGQKDETARNHEGHPWKEKWMSRRQPRRNIQVIAMPGISL